METAAVAWKTYKVAGALIAHCSICSAVHVLATAVGARGDGGWRRGRRGVAAGGWGRGRAGWRRRTICLPRASSPPQCPPSPPVDARHAQPTPALPAPPQAGPYPYWATLTGVLEALTRRRERLRAAKGNSKP
jgi:hypothetical protein